MGITVEMPSATLPELLDALDQGLLLLLPNARAARDLRSTFDARQRSRGLPAWEPPPALSWTQWTNSLWSDLVVSGAEDRLLLNAAQEHSLWREIIADDASNRSLGSVDSLAELAQSAWRLAADYEATQQLRAFAASHDSRTFAAWAESFARHCSDRGYVSTAELNAALAEHSLSGELAAPTTIRLVGFTKILPSQQRLLTTLQERGAAVENRTLKADSLGNQLVAAVVAPTESDERLLAARWIREFLDVHRTADLAARVALLVPNLADERAHLEGVLREVLAPELQSIDTDLSSTPWEFSGGVALSSLTIIIDALEVIRWTQGPLPLERVSSLLLSPYIGKIGTDAGVRDAAARFDVGTLRRQLLLRSELDMPDLLALAQRSGAGRDEALTTFSWLQEVRDFLKESVDLKRPRGFSEWMELVRGVLQAATWPGERALTALEFEATRAWESLLDLLSTLDFSGRRVTLASAIQTLELQAQKAKFTPPALDATVQVMSVAEAQGSVFDAVVFLHATDAKWPPNERVHPLLAWALQRSLEMPGSDSALAVFDCRAVTQSLLQSSGTTLFSYAEEDENGKLRPSPMLRDLGIALVESADLALSKLTADEVQSELVADNSEIPMLPSGEVGGGASVLKLQAACGFLAFAELRLRATEPKAGSLGLDAGESGSLMHRVLQTFWRETKTQDTLRRMSLAERDERLMHAIDAAMSGRLQVQEGWDRAYMWLQKQRLRSVLQQWLEEELRRGPFTVSDVERKELVTVGPLTLEVRVDRVDAVSDGLFFVDYKTGASVDPKQWAGPRPDDPQLPLYTLLAEPDELKGMAFAKVRAGREMKWHGYQAMEGILPGSKSNVRDIAALADEWRHVLVHLAEDFAAGRADVRPKSFATNCVRCAQRLLCRVDPASLLEFADENVDEAEDGLE